MKILNTQIIMLHAEKWLSKTLVRDRFEDFGLEFQESLRHGFLKNILWIIKG